MKLMENHLQFLLYGLVQQQREALDRQTSAGSDTEDGTQLPDQGSIDHEAMEFLRDLRAMPGRDF